jgi:hypothetical protein
LSARRIALLGAGRTGKTTLARELSVHLQQPQFVIEDVGAGVLPIEDLRTCDAVLLMGLDLPCVSADAEAQDAMLRSQLQRAQVPYQVVYGSGPQRLHAALVALEAAGWLPPGTAPRPSGDATRHWAWVCDKCSDPACEHRLFTHLQDRQG